MQPNMFLQKAGCAEDFFSLSLAYILNLFPSIARRFLRRVATLSGHDSEYFGDFIKCEFIGQEYIENHSLSRPDLVITTDSCVLYFENKLDASLRFEQMRRHSLLALQKKNAYLIFVSNIQHECSDLRQLSGYLCPEHSDYYLWQDFTSVFASNARRNSLADRILSDFQVAMRINGMIGRTISGTSGSLYTEGSEAMHFALLQLWRVMYDLGFNLTKKIAREHTIRAYPVKYLQYPLLNPRFIPTAIGLGEKFDREYLEVVVYSKGPAQQLDKALRMFVSDMQCEYVSMINNAANEDDVDGYNCHGFFLMPLYFKGKGKSTAIDFPSLRPQLKRVLDFCKNLQL